MSEHERLTELAKRFLSGFNENDLEAVMSFFSEDGLYSEFTGRDHRGKQAIRSALEPQFKGAFGKMQFIDDDLFTDPENGKVMASWICTLELDGKPTSWSGLDLLHFRGDELVSKLTYAKTKAPLFQKPPAA